MMKPISRHLTTTRLLAVIAIAFILAAAFLVAPALIRNRPKNLGNVKNSGHNKVTLDPAIFATNSLPQDEGVDGRTYAIETVKPAVFTGDVRHLPKVAETEREERELEEPENLKLKSAQAQGPQREQPSVPSISAPMPAANQNFAGMNRNDTCTGGPCGNGSPPDTNGDVGQNYYVQSVNSSFAIYSKTGPLLASFTENQLWSGSGTFCDGNGGGDPVVIYDPMADRWILTNLAFTGNGTVGPFYECIAVSRNNNPVTGGWYLYAIRTDTGVAGQPPTNDINDYPKFGIWTDCLYYSANTFNPSGSYVGGQFGTFSRGDMYAGLPVTAALGFTASTSDFFTMMPSNLSAPGTGGLPPANTPNYYVQESLTAFNWRVRKFTAGANCGGGGTLGAATLVGQTSYNGSGTGVPQPGASNALDTLFDRMMNKNQYRRVGNTESLWIVHPSQASGATNRPQWAQVNVTGGTIVTTAVQQQIYGPDTTLHRWMASIAADKDGNAALGYNSGNGTSPNFPSIAYSGRLAGDPVNTLPQTEIQLVAGTGSQTGLCGGAACTRWGDYASMSVDPADGCTFWYTTEYYTSAANGSNSPPLWSTRIGSFKFPQCVVACPAMPHIKPDNFDADTKSDVAIWQGATTTAWVQLDSNGNQQTIAYWGSSSLGDIPVPGDYDGDGKTDAAVWRPSDGNWYIVNSSGGITVRGWGGSGDVPVAGDYDGDGKFDFAVYRPAEGNWYISKSGGGTQVTGWGAATDKPVPGDYDNDGRSDVAVFRPSEGNWYIIKSSTGGLIQVSFGAASDRLVPADYDGDGRADIAVFRPSEGNWYILNSCSGTMTVRNWGASSDTSVPADYDGDGKADIAVWRPSDGTWYIIKSSDGTILTKTLGNSNDTPVPTAYLPQ